MTLADKEELMR